MIPTKQNCLDGARAHLGDDAVSGGQIFTNTVLEQHFQFAYRELVRALSGVANPRVRRDCYYDLPIFTNYLDPATAGIADFGEPELVGDRGITSQTTITGATAGSGFVTITAAGHPFATGDYAVISSVVGMNGINGIWGVTKIDANSFKANGATVQGTYTSGGIASAGGEDFSDMKKYDRIESLNNSTSGGLGCWAWWDDRFHFPLASSIRELRISYISSAALVVNTSDTTGIDDSLDFLALRTAGLAGASRGAKERANELNMQALGPTLQADGTGGVLRELLVQGLRALGSSQRPPFRVRVNPAANNYV